MSTTDVDHGWKAVLERFKGRTGASIKVGLLEGEGAKAYPEGGLTVADVASFNEFGTDRIPERSFVRGWFDENEDVIRKQIANVAGGVKKGRITFEQAFEQLGLWLVGSMQKRIAQGIEPENAPKTIIRKGSAVPLIDTGMLRQSLKHAVENLT
jgi:hypothetical protein